MNFDAKICPSRARIMGQGDVVIAYERFDSLEYFVLTKGMVFNNKHGAFAHSDFIGQPYGTLVANNRKDGYLYALAPTPELWSLSITTRTQIVDEFDQSFVAFHLDLYPGCRVIETGTGSGANTTSFARAVAPTGHVLSYEFNETRADAARKEVPSFPSLSLSHTSISNYLCPYSLKC